MRFDDQLQADLHSKAEGLPTDTDRALHNVRRQAARRQRTRLLITGSVAALLLTLVAVAWSRGFPTNLGQTPDPAAPSTTTHRPPRTNGGAAHGDPLIGEWQSAAVPAPRIRAAVTAAGITSKTAGRVLTGVRHWVVQMTFGTTLVVETWDPAHPPSTLRLSNPYACHLLPRHRLVLAALKSRAQWSFSYQLAGDRLTLHYIGGTRVAPHDVSTAKLIAWTTAPLRLVHY